MLKSLRRLTVYKQHLKHAKASSCSSSAVKPTITVSPTTCLIDEKIHIQVNGLAPHQLVTLTSSVEEAGSKFEARAVFRANQNGNVDNRHDVSVAGTYTDVDQMGLFWSIKPTPGQKPGLRLVKKDVTTPMDFTVSLYDGSHDGDADIQQTPLSTSTVHRLYKCPSVRRIPMTKGPLYGTIFIPEGNGPFPGVIDTYGGLVSLIETRAALLASHGYATFALSYLYQADLPKTLMTADPNYFKDAIDWFSKQDYIDERRIGAVGLCYGGCLSLWLAAMTPKLRVVVNINGLSGIPDGVKAIDETGKAKIPVLDSKGNQWPNPDLVYATDEGVVIKDCFDCDKPMCIPAWQNGAKILIISGEDDSQVNPKWHQNFVDHCPEQYRSNVELVKYPGAGHFIEPPFAPLCRVLNPGKARLSTLEFLKEEFRGHLFMSGGYPKQHAFAQEDGWQRTLAFLDKHL